MRKLLITLSLGFAAAGLLAQGVVSFNTGPSGVCYLDPNNTGNTNILVRATGTSFYAQLFWSSSATIPDASTMTEVTNAPATFSTLLPGIVNAGSGGGNRTLPFIGSVWVQVRGWDAALGSTWETAWAAYNAAGDPTKLLGFSRIVQTSANIPPNSPGAIGGILGPWFLVPVPEPSILALGILGGVGVLLLRRRK